MESSCCGGEVNRAGRRPASAETLYAGGHILTRTLQSKLKRQRARRQAVFLVFGCTAVVGLVLLVFTLTSPRYDETGNSGIHTQTAGELIQAPEAQQQAAASDRHASTQPGSGGRRDLRPGGGRLDRAERTRFPVGGGLAALRPVRHHRGEPGRAPLQRRLSRSRYRPPWTCGGTLPTGPPWRRPE